MNPASALSLLRTWNAHVLIFDEIDKKDVYTNTNESKRKKKKRKKKKAQGLFINRAV